MAEETKPAVTTEAGVVEPTPAPAETLTADKPAEAVEPAKTEPEAVAPAEEKKEEKAEEKVVEPIFSGALGYKAPGLKNAFRFSKKYFWFGEESISTQNLAHYLRGEKPDVAHPTAAWSNQTGKGLLYFVKHSDQKATPAGVLNLAEVTDNTVTKDGTVAFYFKLHGHKHTFEASSPSERDGWLKAVEKVVEEAKAVAKEITESEGYKEHLGKLGKPAALAATAAKESTPKKSTDVAPKLAEGETAPAAEPSAPARAGSSSSSSSSDEEKKKKSKSKSRSVSRGKRASIFGGFLGKKEKVEEKKEEETHAVAEASTAAPVIPEEIPPKVAEEPKAEETLAPVTETPAEETKAEEKKVEKPKPVKRGSIFGSFVEKLKSPTHEKKESEVAPASPAKESEIPAEAPKIEETPAVAPIEPAAVTDAPKTEEVKPAETKPATTTPHKEKEGFSFGKFLGGAKEKVKSPTTETAPKTEEPAKTEETPAVAEPAVEAPKEETKEEAPLGVTSNATATPAPKPKRGSIFGNLTGSVKKEKEGDSSEPKQNKGLSGLFRSASKAGKAKKEKETPNTPAKVEETAEPKETEEPAKEEPKVEAPATTEPKTIGDVIPDAVTVGQAPKSAPEVSATA